MQTRVGMGRLKRRARRHSKCMVLEAPQMNRSPVGFHRQHRREVGSEGTLSGAHVLSTRNTSETRTIEISYLMFARLSL